MFTAITGQLFPDKKEAAFAHHIGWRSLGQCITFGYGSYLCQNVKIFILMGFCIVATISYIGLEILIRKENKEQQKRYDKVAQNEACETTMSC